MREEGEEGEERGGGEVGAVTTTSVEDPGARAGSTEDDAGAMTDVEVVNVVATRITAATNRTRVQYGFTRARYAASSSYCNSACGRMPRRSSSRMG